jgi:hypothetical protein
MATLAEQPGGASVRPVSEIVTLRVKDLIAALADRKKIKPSEAQDAVSDAMAVRLKIDKHTVRRQLDRYLTGETRDGERMVRHRWRIDYLEALSDAVGVSLADLVSTTAGRTHVEPQTMSQRLFKLLGRTVDEEMAEVVVSASRELMADRPRFDLAVAVTGAITRAESRGEAIAQVARMISESDAIPLEKRQPSRPAKKTRRGA